MFTSLQSEIRCKIKNKTDSLNADSLSLYLILCELCKTIYCIVLYCRFLCCITTIDVKNLVFHTLQRSFQYSQPSSNTVQIVIVLPTPDLLPTYPKRTKYLNFIINTFCYYNWNGRISMDCLTWKRKTGRVESSVMNQVQKFLNRKSRLRNRGQYLFNINDECRVTL